MRLCGVQNKGEWKMCNLPDDPIISYIERTGYAPWMQDDDEYDEPFAVYEGE